MGIKKFHIICDLHILGTQIKGFIFETLIFRLGRERCMFKFFFNDCVIRVKGRPIKIKELVD